MKIFAAILRITLFIIWIRIIYLSDFDFANTDLFIWISVIIVAIYLAIITQFWIEAVWCPMCKKWKCKIK